MLEEVDRLLSLYERRAISRRGLAEAVAAMCVASAGAAKAQAAAPAVAPTRTLNHVSLVTADLAKTKAFYSRLTGLPVRGEAPGMFCEFKLENGFLGLYSQDFVARFAPKGEPAPPNGFNHLCLGVDGYNSKALAADINRAMPEAKAEVANGELYVRDPDGVRVQFADVTYKR
jgi:catechol 2,3-dioxygenase-like lactoylglutathione lyase family enzyme